MSALAKTTYFWRSAFHGVRRQPFVHGIAILTLAIALFAAGLTRAVDTLLQGVLASLEGQVRLTAYLAPSVAPAAQSQLAAGLETSLKTPVRLVTPEMAMSRLAAQLPELGGVLERVSDNPLPASLELDVPGGWREPGRLEQLAVQLRAVEGVTEVDYGEEAVKRLSTLARAIRLAALFAFIVVLGATIVIVSATLQLAIYSRRTEIEIQKLVGATNRFVKVPFLLEGFLQGALGAMLAVAALAALFHFAGPRLQALFTYLSLPTSASLLTPILCAEVLGAGVLLGLSGSAIAVGRFLKG